MRVREVGGGPAVLLVHGTPSPAEDWAPVVEALRATHRVIVPELPGYGYSEPPVDASMEAIGNDLAAMLAERGVHRLRGAVGFSTGAYRMFDLALRHVEIDQLVSLGGVVAFDHDARALRRELARRIVDDPAVLDSDESAVMLRQLLLSPGWCEQHPADVARVVQWPRTTTPRALAAELVALADSRDLRPELARLTGRVYVRVGALDLGCPVAWSRELAALTNGELEIVPGCGHALLIEDRRDTVASIVARLG